jgi:hypothetical protein
MRKKAVAPASTSTGSPRRSPRDKLGTGGTLSCVKGQPRLIGRRQGDLLGTAATPRRGRFIDSIE